MVVTAVAAATSTAGSLFGRPRLRLLAPLALLSSPVVVAAAAAESFALALPAFASVVVAAGPLLPPTGFRAAPHSMSIPRQRLLLALMSFASCATLEEAVLLPLLMRLLSVAVPASAVAGAPRPVVMLGTDPTADLLTAAAVLVTVAAAAAAARPTATSVSATRCPSSSSSSRS